MPRTFAAVPLLALALSLPVPALAGPPEWPSGKLVFVDEVADGLRKYRWEPDPEKRIKWLRRMAPTCDPRIALELGETWTEVRGKQSSAVRDVALDCLADYYVHFRVRPLSQANLGLNVSLWWYVSEADLRRRAKQLPQ
jgi:hypothetical protein